MTRPQTRTIYLLHFDRPLNHARHYLGSADDLAARLADHERGCGARLLAVLRERGIGWRLVRTWRGDRTQERRLKRYGGHGPALCPVCRAAAGRPIVRSRLVSPAPGQPV